MNTIREHLGLDTSWHHAYALSNIAVGQKHKLLHQLVGVHRHLGIGAYRMPLVIKFKAHFLTFKLYCTVFGALCPQLLCNAVKQNQLFGKLTHRRPVSIGLDTHGVKARLGEIFG